MLLLPEDLPQWLNFDHFDLQKTTDQLHYIPTQHLLNTNNVWPLFFEKLKQLANLNIPAHIVCTQGEFCYVPLDAELVESEDGFLKHA